LFLDLQTNEQIIEPTIQTADTASNFETQGTGLNSQLNVRTSLLSRTNLPTNQKKINKQTN
jgi:hypothetical protein